MLSTANETPPDSAKAPDPPTRAGRSGKLHAITTKHPDSAAWQRGLAAVGAWFSGQLGRPRTRLAVIGAILLLVALLGVFSSVWTLPLVIVGAAMVLIAWIGARLNGRFAIEWGETGTQLEFRAQIKAPAVLPVVVVDPVPAVRIPTLAELDDPNVIEGEGHTVEIDVTELKALIVAAEAQEAKDAMRAEAVKPAVHASASSGAQPSVDSAVPAASPDAPAQRNRPAA